MREELRTDTRRSKLGSTKSLRCDHVISKTKTTSIGTVRQDKCVHTGSESLLERVVEVDLGDADGTPVISIRCVVRIELCVDLVYFIVKPIWGVIPLRV